MLLICDSGSTKADWKLSDGQKEIDSFSTMGFNPFFHTEETVYHELKKNERMWDIAFEVKNVYFYGAGCSSPERNAIIQKGLQRVFRNAKVLVEHDILGAAIAACGDQPGITCILGTGSNSCYYDGKNLKHLPSGFGYILGDEGSGGYLGRHLLSLFMYGLTPQDITDELTNKYGLNNEIIYQKVYHEPDANVYMASFAKVLSNHKDSEFVQKLVNQAFTNFLDIDVARYTLEVKQVSINFIGSVASNFKENLQTLLAQRGWTMGKVTSEPIKELLQYYQNKQ